MDKIKEKFILNISMWQSLHTNDICTVDRVENERVTSVPRLQFTKLCKAIQDYV